MAVRRHPVPLTDRRRSSAGELSARSGQVRQAGRRWAALLAGVGLVAAACSGGSDPGGVGQAPTTVAVTEAPATTTTVSPAVTALVDVLTRRLALAVDIARTKWNTKAPIEDLAREAQAIDAVGQVATVAGVDPGTARRVLQAQIEAGKIVQRSLHEQWTAEGRPPFESVQDLVTGLRPQLDEITVQLVTALRSTGPLPVLSGQAGPDAERSMADRLTGVPRAADAARTALAPLRA